MGDQREEKRQASVSNAVRQISEHINIILPAIFRHYTHRQKRCKHLMQYFTSNGLFELKVKVYAFLLM